MFSIIKRILRLSGKYRPRVIAGLIFNALKSCCAAFVFFAVLLVMLNIEHLTETVILQAFGIVALIIYMVLAAFSGTYIPFLFFSNQTLEQYAGMFGESYLGILQTLVSPVTAIIMLVVVAICAFVGALNAKKLLKKHFKKAGMV